MTNGSGQKEAADLSRRLTLGRGRGQTGLPRSTQQNPKSNASPSVETAINTAAECPRSSHIDAPWPTSCRGGGYAAESGTLRLERPPGGRSVDRERGRRRLAVAAFGADGRRSTAPPSFFDGRNERRRRWRFTKQRL